MRDGQGTDFEKRTAAASLRWSRILASSNLNHLAHRLHAILVTHRLLLSSKKPQILKVRNLL